MSKNIDEVGNKELIDKLQSLGLNEKESAVYLALLPRQDVGSSVLIKLTGLHGQFVYNSLAKLEELGLVRHVIQNGRKKFSANAPARLLSIVEERRLTTQAVIAELQHKFAHKHKQDFEVYQGENAFALHELDMLKRCQPNTVLDVIASKTERYMLMLEEVGVAREYEKIRKEKNISVRYLGTESQREALRSREASWGLWSYKLLPSSGTGLLSIEIWPEAVSFAVYGDTLLNFTLTSKEVAAGYREFFEALWNLSSK